MVKKAKNFKKKFSSLGYRTPDRFRQLILKRNPFTRPRSLGGHR